MIRIPQVFGSTAAQRLTPLNIAVGVIAAVMSLFYGFNLSQDTSLLLLVTIAGGAIVTILAFAAPGYAASVLLGVGWANLSDVAIKVQGLPSLNKPLVGLLIGVLIINRLIGRRQTFVRDLLLWWLLGYLGVVALGLVYAPFPERVLDPTIELAKDLVIFFVLINLLDSETVFERAMWFLLGLGTLLGTLTVYQEITQTYSNTYGGLARVKIAEIAAGLDDRARAAGTIGDPNYYGQLLILMIPIGFWAIVNAQSLFGKLFGGYATIICLSALVLTYSRGAYLALFIVIVLMAIRARLDMRYLLVVPIIAGLLMIAPPEFQARIGTLGDIVPSGEASSISSSDDRSLRGRYNYVIVGLDIFGDYPVLGVGQNNFPPIYQRYIRERGSAVSDQERPAHNLYLQVTTEHGLVGAFVFGTILVLTWRRLSAAQKLFTMAGNQRHANLASALQVAFVGYLVTAFFLHGAYPMFLWLQINMAVALFVIATKAAYQVNAQAPIGSTVGVQ